jgi:multiple antibiotic resistance protein
MADHSTLFFTFQTLASLLVIIDPFGNVAFFATITAKMDQPQRIRFAWRNSIFAALVLLAFAAFGSALLELFNVQFPALRISGGILLLIIALRVLSGRQFKWQDDQQFFTGETGLLNSVVPLGIPLMAGPGAMAMVLVLAEKAQGVTQLIIVLASISGVCLLGGLCYHFSLKLIEKLGRTTMVTLSSLMGLILAALAVQFMLDGLHQAIPTLFAQLNAN